jgi:hypothetical protein
VDKGSIVPVLTSVVGMSPSGGASTKSASSTTVTVGRTTTTATAPFGESERPITVPSRAAAPLDPAAPAAEAAARAFLERYWSPGARTSAQLADAVAPYATDRILAVYRDPARADQAVPGAGVGEITVRASEATASSAVVVGSGTMVDEPDRRVIYRTLTLVRGSDGTWRVDVIR